MDEPIQKKEGVKSKCCGSDVLIGASKLYWCSGCEKICSTKPLEEIPSPIMKDTTQKESWQDRFDKGCNTDNISDPPSDTRWIKAFIQQEINKAKEEERGRIAEWASENTKDSPNAESVGYNMCLVEILSFLNHPDS